MKRLLVIIIPILLILAVFAGAVFTNECLTGEFVDNGLANMFGRDNQYTPDADSYRIFDGGMMGEYNTDKTENNYYNDSYYNQLTPNEKAVYDSVVNCDISTLKAVAVLPEPVYFYSASAAPTEEEMVSVGTYLSRTYQRALDALMMDGSKAFFIQMGEGGSLCKYQYRMVNNDDRYVWCIDAIETDIVIKDCYKDNIDEIASVTDAQANSFAAKGDTRYQRVKSIHDYIVQGAFYEDTPYADDAYGILIDKKATCSGFSRAFKLLCDKNNIPCALVTGVGITQKESGEHMWCLVQMEDGLWYGVDPTWDDYGGDEYLLVGGDTVSKFSGLKFSETHIPSEDFTGFGYTPFVYPSLSDNKYLK